MTPHLATRHRAPKHRTAVQVVIGVVIGMAVAGAGAGAYFWLTRPATPTVLVNGEVTIVDNDPLSTHFTWDSSPPTCAGEDKFADLAQGTAVVVRDQRGRTIGADHLGPGDPGDIRKDPLGRSAHTCVFRFSVRDVPHQRFYTVVVAGRAPSTVGGGQLEADGVRLVYGS